MIQNFKSHHSRPKLTGDLPQPPFCCLVKPTQITWSYHTFVFAFSIFQHFQGPHGKKSTWATQVEESDAHLCMLACYIKTTFRAFVFILKLNSRGFRKKA